MLGYFINRGLLMLFGYAYPAFECYKTVEKNRIEIEQLRFWCQYWIIVALLTVFERIGDIFLSWLPMYCEVKLAFFIYLWYPKTKGTSYVYETFFRPYIGKHETEIDRKLLELRSRAWDYVIFHWQNCASYGQTSFFQFLQFIAAQSSKVKKDPSSQKVDPQPPSPPTPRPMASGEGQLPNEQTQQSSKKKPSTPPQRTISMKPSEIQSPTQRTVSVKRSEIQSPPKLMKRSKSDVVQDQLPCEIPADDGNGPPATEEDILAETLRAARIRLRRSQSRSNE